MVGDEDIEGGPPKIFTQLKEGGGSEKIVGLGEGL